ncbi:MAG: hypothetical protein GX339_08225 [Tissierellia bacterium]|nr:hypothetical protein [Tissierellia bacterium]
MFDLRSIVIGTVLMLKKYTCVNITIYAETNEEDFKNGIMALPIIGLAIGFFAFIIAAFRFLYDSLFIGSIVLLYYSIITKAANLKDLYKTIAYYSKLFKETDEIWSIIGTVIICLMYFSLFRIVPLTSLMLMPMVGFSTLIVLSKIIRRNISETSILKNCEKHHVVTAFVISFFLIVVLNYKLVISLSLTYMAIGMVVSLLDKKIKNLPSSIEGCIVEISQIIFLLITYLLKL